MSIAFLILFTLWFAWGSAKEDAYCIAKGRPIAHAAQWLFRAGVTVLFCNVLGHLWLSIGLAFLFSAVFRFTLNYQRGLDWRYVSTSNIYDSVFIWLARGRVHRAGTIAYITELVVVILHAC
jgi:hypothetical protein